MCPLNPSIVGHTKYSVPPLKDQRGDTEFDGDTQFDVTTTLKWFTSYLSHRCQAMKNGSTLSEWGSGTKYSPGRRHNRCDLNKKCMRQKNQEVANINLSDFWIYTHLSYKKYNGNSVINNIN